MSLSPALLVGLGMVALGLARSGAAAPAAAPPRTAGGGSTHGRAEVLARQTGGSDAHAPLGRGTVDWPAVMAAAARGGADPALVLEYDIGTDLRRLAEGKAFLSGITSNQGGEDDEDN